MKRAVAIDSQAGAPMSSSSLSAKDGESSLPTRAIFADTRALDTHLQILQALSAHVKLLLDAPEHLWRLIERKKYLHAAWLFLLGKVVHRALVREDPDDEEGWDRHGIDVLVCIVRSECLLCPQMYIGTISSGAQSMGHRFPVSLANRS